MSTRVHTADVANLAVSIVLGRHLCELYDSFDVTGDPAHDIWPRDERFLLIEDGGNCEAIAIAGDPLTLYASLGRLLANAGLLTVENGHVPVPVRHHGASA